MKLSVYLAKDKSRLPGAREAAKAPVAEIKGVPARVTTYARADGSHGAEAVVIVERGRIRSVVASGGEMKLYLSPRARFRCIAPDAPKTTSPLKPEEGLNGPPAPALIPTIEEMCGSIDFGADIFEDPRERPGAIVMLCPPCADGCHTMCWNPNAVGSVMERECECRHPSHFPEGS